MNKKKKRLNVMSQTEIFIGLVKNGKFHGILPKSIQGGPVLLTRIRVMESVSPESGQLNLVEYEGSAIAVQGINQGGAIYEASILESGGYILTALVKEIS
jgi:hypothetical protein